MIDRCRCVLFTLIGLFCCFSLPARAQPADTQIQGVTAEVVELRVNGGVTHLAVQLTNNTDADASGDAMYLSNIVIVDAKSKKKFLPLKAADGHCIGGPVDDNNWEDCGKFYVKVPAHGRLIIWAYFDPFPVGSKLTVQLPQMFPFDDVVVTQGPGKRTSSTMTVGEIAKLQLTLVSAKRADQQLQLRLKMAEFMPDGSAPAPAIYYSDVFFFDPASMRKYPVLKDDQGNYSAQPTDDLDGGGRYRPSYYPGKVTLMSLSIQAPPDTVTTGDLLVPGFLPMEAVAISGQGGAPTAGIAAAGQSLGLQGALMDLKAEVTSKEIKVNLSADVLFDFNKSDLKLAAESALRDLLTVVQANPAAPVLVEGYTDALGANDYNQKLSERRAESVKAWLVAHGVNAGTISTKGWGAANPVAPNKNPNGSDNPAGRQKNRRVEITIRKG